MKVNFDLAFRQTFDDSEWLAKMAIAGLFYLASSFISFITNMLGNFASAIAGEGSDTSYAIAAFLAIISIIVALVTYFINCFPTGFLLQTIHNEITGEEPFLPEWAGNWKKFFLSGFKINCAIGIYVFTALIPLILGMIIATILGGTAIWGSSGGAADMTFDQFMGRVGIWGGASLLITLFLAFVIGWIMPMIMVHAAVKNSFFAAFNLSVILGKIFVNFVDYTIVTVCVIALYIIFGIAIGITACCTCGITALLAPALMVPLGIIIMNLYAQLYAAD